MEQASLDGFDNDLAPPSWADEEIPISAYTPEDEINDDIADDIDFMYGLQGDGEHKPKKTYESTFEKITDNLNEQQLKAVTLDKNIGPVMVLAGAGTGKTAVLTRRIAHMVADGVSPRRILAVTFTNKAAKEMKERLKIFDVEPPPLVGTFHSIGLRILKIEPEAAGVKKNFTVMDESDCDALWKRLFIVKKDEVPNPYKYQFRHNDDSALNFKKMMFDYKEKGVRSSRTNIDGLNADVLAMLDIYEEARKEMNLVDFSDLISASLLALNGNGKAREWADRFTHLLVDEFQDTSAVQYDWCKSLLIHGDKTERNIFCVGDDNQSIYSFRGAVVKNIDTFVRDFKAIEIKLEQNYRCKKEILSNANRLIANNPNGDKKRLWSTFSGGRVECRAFKKDMEEAFWIAADIRIKKDFEHTAVLLRTRGAMVVILNYLRQLGIPYQVVGAQDFFDKKEIRDSIALLRFATNPKDHLSFIRSANLFQGVGKTSVDRIVKGALDNDISIVDICANSSNEKIKRIGQIFSKIKPESDASKSLEFLIREVGLNEMYQEEPERIASMKELVEMAGSAANLKSFLEQITLFAEKKESRMGVTVSTIHAAKGLEWKSVYLPALSEGHLPSYRPDEYDTREEEMEQIREERRLMYVAITRAKQDIYASWSSSRMMFGRPMDVSPSRFLRESGLDMNYVDDVELKKNAKHAMR